VKGKEMLVARQELRHQDKAGTWQVVEEGERVPRDHFLVSVHPSMFFVDTDELVALETLKNLDVEGNVRTVRKGDVLDPGDPLCALHPTLVGPAIYRLEEEPAA
jgi:hypothetical protein